MTARAMSYRLHDIVVARRRRRLKSASDTAKPAEAGWLDDDTPIPACRGRLCPDQAQTSSLRRRRGIRRSTQHDNGALVFPLRRCASAFQPSSSFAPFVVRHSRVYCKGGRLLRQQGRSTAPAPPMLCSQRRLNAAGGCRVPRHDNRRCRPPRPQEVYHGRHRIHGMKRHLFPFRVFRAFRGSHLSGVVARRRRRFEIGV